MTSTTSATEHYDQLKRDWELEQTVSVLFSNALGAIIGNLFNISLVGFLLLDIYSDSWLPVWFAIGLLLNGFRLLLWFRYKRSPASLACARWLQIYRVTTFLSGLHFGVLALFYFSSDAPLYQTLVACFICGSVAAAVGTHGVDSTTYRLFMFPSALPLMVRAAIEGTNIHVALAVMVFFLMLVMLRCANQTQKTMRDNMHMSYSLNYRATHDPLVALYNREEFKSEFEKTRTLEEHRGNLIAFVFIDLDNFKHVNDTQGHDAGDRALIRISEIIRTSIRKTDVAARFGGDEFLLLLHVDEVDEALLVCDKIVRSIDLARMDLAGAEKLGASLGVGYTRDESATFDSILKAADRACYEAKRLGKGQAFAIEVEQNPLIPLKV